MYRPNPKQAAFHKAGSTKRERAILAANRSGKTLSCGYELAMHATGQYPDWWEGRRFARPIMAWAAGKSNETTRDVVQGMLLGDNEVEWGTGALPKACIAKVDKSRGITGAVDKVFIKHVSGGISIIQFKSYEQGWEKWTGAEVDVVWFDEEPPEKVYKEGLTRTNNTRGIAFLSLTPLLGMTQVVSLFYPKPESPTRHLTMMTIDDALHFDAEQRQMMIDQYQPYEREARLRGIPMLGSGRVFPLAEEIVTVEPFQIPEYWPQIIGIDFGWDHPTAAANLAYDRDVDCLYVTREYRVSEEAPVVHAAAIKAWGSWIPVSWPHDGRRDMGYADQQIAQEYRDWGLRMHFEHATFENGSNSLEAGVTEMLDRMRTGRWKVFNTCTMWLDEFRVYHRKDGKIVKEFDDLLSASRYAMMMRRVARTQMRRVHHTRPPDWSPLSVA